VKNVEAILETAANHNLTVTLIDADEAETAQHNPCAFGTFCILNKGEIISHHPISNTRFENILKTLKATYKKYSLIFLFLIPIFVYPQDVKKPVSLTLKVGYTAANMYGRDTESTTFLNGDSPESFYANNPAGRKLKSGLCLGAALEKRVGKRTSMGMEILYIQKGTGINIPKHWNYVDQVYEDVKDRVHWDQHYVSFAFPVAVYFPHGQNEFYIRGGLFVDKLLASKEHGKITIAGETYTYENDRVANNVEPGFFTGCGYVLSLPDHDLIFEFDWSRCILFSAGSDMIPNPQQYYNQTFELRVGYQIHIFRHN
jgi:hypothetical protein